MKLVFKKEELMNSINIVSKAVPVRSTNPVLECILFDASGEKIKLISNDNDFGIETIVEGKIEEKGKVAIDAKLISEIIRKAESNESIIKITCDRNLNIELESDNSLFIIQGRDGEEFPYLADIEKDKYVSLSYLTFKEIVRQTNFSASLNDNNKMMGGENIEIEGNYAKFTTLDGHRVSIRKIELKDNYGKMNAIVPVRSLNEISKILTGDNEKELLIYFNRNYLLFEFENTSVITRVIDGEYFKINHMITKDYLTKIRINKQKLISSIDRTMIFVKENDHKPILMNINENVLNVSIKSSYGAMDENIDCLKAGDNLKIAFNPKFVIDALRAIDDEDVDLYFTTSKAPCFIREEKENYIYLILPVNFIE